MPPARLLMLRRFFQDYKQLEGKAVEVDEIRPAGEAYPIILDALHRYSEQRRKGFQPVKHRDGLPSLEDEADPLGFVASDRDRLRGRPHLLLPSLAGVRPPRHPAPLEAPVP